MRTGAGLPIETTVMLVLAVVVLATLLFMFFGATRDQTAGNEIQRTSACRAYATQNPKCTSASADGDTLNKIAQACRGLGGYSACTGGAANLACILQCCRMFCPSATECGAEFGDTIIPGRECIDKQCDTGKNQCVCREEWQKPGGGTCIKAGSPAGSCPCPP